MSIEKVGNIYEGVPLLMDRAYEGDKTRSLAEAYSHKPVVPPKKNHKEPWDYDKDLYKRRNIIERLFRWLKESRKVITRYDKLDSMYFAFYSVCLYYGVVVIVSADSSNDVNKGQIDLGNLLFDDYYLVETSAPAGYIPQ